MHTWEKSLKEDNFRKNSDNPSFSSTLLDEIYRSIDKKEGENQENTVNRNGVREKINNLTEDEEMSKLRRACLIDKWMEKKVNGKSLNKEQPLMQEFEKDSYQDNDPLFFSSSSISSDSSSGGLSSSDTEFFSAAKTRKSCFVSPWPKPIKTKVSSQKGHVHQEYQNQAKTENLIRSRSRAMKIYANLKNVKQPISPGGRLTSFISSIFTNGCPKNSKSCNNNSSRNTDEVAKIERKSKSTQTSACSSATSFSRSCLSKIPHCSKGNNNLHQENAKRTVSFYADEDYLGPRTPFSEDMKLDKMQSGLTAHNRHQKKKDVLVERSNLDDEEDAASDCSSDLFEIDHLVLFRNESFCEELPVYETTHYDKNLAIASGRVR